jgi:hypothetical protein
MELKRKGSVRDRLQDWINANWLAPNPQNPNYEPIDRLKEAGLFGAKAAWSQAFFCRDALPWLLNCEQPEVVGTHTSKSICLPVYRFAWNDIPLTVTMRDNFCNWVVDIESEEEIPRELLFDLPRSEHSCREGMPPIQPGAIDLIISSEYILFALLYGIVRYLRKGADE